MSANLGLCNLPNTDVSHLALVSLTVHLYKMFCFDEMTNCFFFGQNLISIRETIVHWFGSVWRHYNPVMSGIIVTAKSCIDDVSLSYNLIRNVFVITPFVWFVCINNSSESYKNYKKVQLRNWQNNWYQYSRSTNIGYFVRVVLLFFPLTLINPINIH